MPVRGAAGTTGKFRVLAGNRGCRMLNFVSEKQLTIRTGRTTTENKKQALEHQARELNLLTALMEWLQALPLAVFIHQSKWVFTTIEVVHVIAISLVIASIAIVDLRLLGVASTKRPFTKLAREVLPWTWAAFVLAAMAGSLLFISQATAYFASATFWIKMSIIVLAGINMLIFEFITVRGVQKWDLDPTLPLPARLAGGISFTCWILVFIFGRWNGFSVIPE